MCDMRKNYLLVWIDKDLSKIHTECGNYNEMKEYATKLSKNENIISIDLYEKTESIKNTVADFFLEK